MNSVKENPAVYRSYPFLYSPFNLITGQSLPHKIRSVLNVAMTKSKYG